jgi:hypothetical protein
VVAVELVTLAVQVGLGGVEVFRAGAVVVAAGGVASADEAAHFAVVVDRRDEPVAEAVDDAPGAGVGAEAGGHDVGVGRAEAVQVLGERGPRCGGVAGLESFVAGEVVTEPAGDVGGGPRVGVVGTEEVQRVLIEFDEPGVGGASGATKLQPEQRVAGLVEVDLHGTAVAERGRIRVCVGVLWLGSGLVGMAGLGGREAGEPVFVLLGAGVGQLRELGVGDRGRRVLLLDGGPRGVGVGEQADPPGQGGGQLVAAEGLVVGLAADEQFVGGADDFAGLPVGALGLGDGGDEGWPGGVGQDAVGRCGADDVDQLRYPVRA